jgi:hypothetical protein
VQVHDTVRHETIVTSESDVSGHPHGPYTGVVLGDENYDQHDPGQPEQ